MSYRSALKVLLPLILVFVAACGNDDDDQNDDCVGAACQQDGGPTDQDQTDVDGDASPGDEDNGDGDSGPPPVYGLDARPQQQDCQAFTAPPVSGTPQFVDRFPNIRFDGSVSMSQRPGDNSRIYANERGGRIYSFPNDPAATADQKQLALDLSDRQFTGWDCSTAALVFPENFEESHAAYVVYCQQFDAGGGNPHIQIRLSRFYTTDGGLTFDKASEQVLVAINYLESDDPVDPEYQRTCGHVVGEDGLHAGNAAHFGSDGYLYWSVGDGGPQGHCGGKQAQHLSTLRGKLLRLDVSNLTKQIDPANLGFNEGWQYTTGVDFPLDNPFVETGAVDPNPTHGLDNDVVQPFIFARGFRNPWQWNFDPANGNIWLGDVGNGTWEEVNRQVISGGNYGWGYFEGYQCQNDWGGWEYPFIDDGTFNSACSTFYNQVQWPIAHLRHGPSYDRDGTPEASRLPGEIYGAAISGGTVYRGTQVPAYTGSYFFGDYSSQRIWAIRNVDAIGANVGAVCTSSADCDTGLKCKSREVPYEDTDGEGPGGGFDPAIVGPPPANEARCTADFEFVQGGVPVASFSRDQDNNVYAVMLYGAPGTGNGWIGMLRAPAATGGTGGPPALLSDTGCFTVTDNAGVETVAEPASDLVPFAPSAQLWSDGATKRRWMVVPDAANVTVDAAGDFEFPLGSVLIKEFSWEGQKIETRFLVRQVADGNWAAYTYEWNDEQTDATLVPELGAEKDWNGKNWKYPSRTQCFRCHNTVDKVALGPETAQLNHDLEYAATGKTANQMQTLEHIGLVNTANDPAPWDNLAAITDTTRSVEERARAYLHANCSNCHRPNGPTFTPADMRYSTPFASMNLLCAPPSISAMEDVIDGPSRLLWPGDPEHSQVYMRPGTLVQSYRMPPLATSEVHTDALGVIAEWIESIPGTCE